MTYYSLLADSRSRNIDGQVTNIPPRGTNHVLITSRCLMSNIDEERVLLLPTELTQRILYNHEHL